MNLGQLIRQQRKLKGYTQEQLGSLIGVSKMAISKYERNVIDNIERKKMISLSQILDIPIQAFLTSDTTTPKQIDRDNFYYEIKSLLECDLSEEKRKQIINFLEFVTKNDDK